MNTLDAIRDRYSYRGKFLSTPVPRADLIQILEAGYHAPSGCNKQTTRLIAVDDPKVLKKLHGVIDPPIGETAPAMICVLTERIVAYRDRCFATQDYSAAIENMLLAITALFFSGQYEGVIVSFITVTLGSLAAALMIGEEGKRTKPRRRQKRT